MPIQCILDVTNKTEHSLPAKRFFILAAERTLRVLHPAAFPKKLEVSLFFVPKNEIRRLNKAFRGKDKPTDVLSFPNFSSASIRVSGVRVHPRLRLPKLGKIVPTEDADGVVRLGEIIVAPEVVAKEASLFGHSVRKHHVFLFVHGLLHLIGYDHERSKKEEKEMFSLQEQIFKSVF